MVMKAKCKKLVCPVCKARLIDASETNVSELISEEDYTEDMKYDYKQKCWNCKKQIYIKKVS